MHASHKVAAGRFVLALLVMLGLGASPASAAARVALVIGNGAYKEAPALPNPPRDAAAIATTLRDLGFDVVEGLDLDRRAMETKIRDFGRRAEEARTALVFYAGHGVQVNGENYLIPVDAKLKNASDLDFDAVSLKLVLGQAEGGDRTSLIFLDACRDNPFTRSLARSMRTRSGAVGQGLAPVQTGTGTMIAFATAPGEVALDGAGSNSPFTTALVKHIKTPGLDIEAVMRRVSADVYEETRQKQQPWKNSSLMGDVVLVPGGASPGTSAKAEPAKPEPAKPEPAKPDAAASTAFSEREAFAFARTLDTSDAWAAFLKQYPSGSLAPFAKAARDKLTEPAEPARTPAPTKQASLPPPPPPAASRGAPGLIFPDSDRRYLTYDEASRLSRGQLRIARNEIFARRGRFFDSDDLKAHFSRFAWYRPSTWSPSLSPVEKANSELLLSVERSR